MCKLEKKHVIVSTQENTPASARITLICSCMTTRLFMVKWPRS